MRPAAQPMDDFIFEESVTWGGELEPREFSGPSASMSGQRPAPIERADDPGARRKKDRSLPETWKKTR